MLKNISNLGKTLNKAEQLTITGGRYECYFDMDCPGAAVCTNNACTWPGI